MEQRTATPVLVTESPFIGNPSDPIDPSLAVYLRRFAMLPMLDPYLEAHNRLAARSYPQLPYGTLEQRCEFERLVNLVIGENRLRDEMNAKRRAIPEWP